jgi:acyl-coenzyme A synthetase/AMP-(fatty) acid ligase
LVYRGANICLGYAQSGEDLALGDGWKGVLHTGDMARRDAEGYYYIVGRKARFVKIAGKRISLDEVEQLIKTGFPGLVCACGGIDENLFVFVETSPVSLPNEPRESERRGQEKFGNAVKKFISAKSGINYVFMQVVTLAELPKNAAGKILYAELAKYYSGGAGSS